MNRKLSRKLNSRKQRGGCGLKPLSPASLDMGSLTGGRRRRRTNRRKSKRMKKGGNVGALAAAGLLGTLLAFGSRKHKSKGKRTRRRRSSKRR